MTEQLQLTALTEAEPLVTAIRGLVSTGHELCPEARLLIEMAAKVQQGGAVDLDQLLPPVAAVSIFAAEDYDPMQDMTCQPTHCECGQPFRRHGVWLICKAGHELGMDCVGRQDHPRNAEWEAYLDTNGRDAFQSAIERHMSRFTP